MIRGLYSSASGMIAEFQRSEVISNNIANVNTPAFKRDIAVFKDYLKSYEHSFGNTSRISQSPEVDKAIRSTTNRLTKLSEIKPDWNEGPMLETGDHRDIAIKGSGFFKLLTPNGIRYTRNGTLDISKKGELVDPNGNYYLGAKDKKIKIGAVFAIGSNFAVGSDGNISVNGASAGKLLLVDFDKPYEMVKKGGGYYYFDKPKAGGKEPLPAEKPAKNGIIVQGIMERSNVNTVTEMVNMINSMRAFEGYQKMIQSVMTDTTQKTVNELGRVRA